MVREKDVTQERIYFFSADFGFATKGGGVVNQVTPGSQAAEKGVRKGWRVVAIDDEAVPPTLFDSDLARRLKTAFSRGGDCVQVTFSVPASKKEDSPKADRQKEASGSSRYVDREKVKQFTAKLSAPTAVSKDDRRKNLQELASLSTPEANMVMQNQAVVQNLLGNAVTDELCVLLCDKTAEQVQAMERVRERMAEGTTPTAEEVRKVDLAHKDEHGNTLMHLARSAKAFEALLRVAELNAGGKRGTHGRGYARKLFQIRNKNGETAMETAIRRARDSAPETTELVQFFQEHVPEAVRDSMNQVLVLVPMAERVNLLKAKISWPEVRSVLLGNDHSALEIGYSKLSKTLRESVPKLEAEDHVGVWTELLAEHCFGVLQPSEDGAGGPGKVKHCEASRERLGVVWKALRQLLEASSDPGLSKPESNRVKDITKGLLMATLGPSQQDLDPREPYRDAFTGCIRELQSCTATRLADALKAAIETSPDAAEDIRRLPREELRGVDTAAAAARGATARLRMDTPLAAHALRDSAGGDTGKVLDKPEWVFEQSLGQGLFEELKRKGCVERASDLVDIADGGIAGPFRPSDKLQQGLPQERLRFCRLHAAWMRGVCSEQQAEVTQRLRAAVGLADLTDDGKGGPWEAGGGSQVTFFRTRSEVKGLKRIMEKMHAALEEEVLEGETYSLLQSHAKLADKAEDDVAGASSCKLAAVRELLTPACFICDVNGAEVVVDSFSDMSALYKHLAGQSLQKDGCQVVRIKNGFSHEISAAEAASNGGYRDLKLWLMIPAGGVRLLAELQVHLRCFYELKRVMHLTYECARGSFDHPHLLGLWCPEEPPRPEGSRCCAGCTVS